MKKIVLLVVMAMVFVLGGCATSHPIHNITAEPVVGPSGRAVTMDEVGKAILRAGATMGWQMKQMEPGYIVGTLKLREHVAVVDIRYTAKSYNITYKDSTNLQYDGANIHRNYNGWISNLDRAIKAQLATL